MKNSEAEVSTSARNLLAASPRLDNDEMEDEIDHIARQIAEEDWSLTHEDNQYTRRWKKRVESKCKRGTEQKDAPRDDEENHMKTPSITTSSLEPVRDISDLVQGLLPVYHQQIFIAAGLSFFSDAIEIMATFFLAIQVNENNFQSAVIVSSLFLGILIGTSFATKMSSMFGKYRVYCAMTLLLPVSGSLTLLAEDYLTMAIVRFFVGFAASGRVLAFQLLDEFSTKSQPNVWIHTQFFWSAGVVLVVCLASITDWMNMIFILEIFVAGASFVSMALMFESPSWLMKKGEVEKIILFFAQRSGPNFNCIIEVMPNAEASISRNDQWMLWILWFFFGIMYYGSIYMVHDMYYNDRNYFGTIVVCAEIEIVGIFLGWFGVKHIGSRMTQVFGFSLAANGIFFLAIYEEHSVIPIISAAAIRFGLMVAGTASLSYAESASLASPLSFSMAYFGGLVSPYLMGSSFGVIISSFVLQIILFLHYFL
mmetsp:Transcript_8062/g.12329  ORF Transcript_8062/g.12329 Transcript_8062/m.12329 type:complete len:481 (-) Transcript_8062:153-1595(-)